MMMLMLIGSSFILFEQIVIESKIELKEEELVVVVVSLTRHIGRKRQRKKFIVVVALFVDETRQNIIGLDVIEQQNKDENKKRRIVCCCYFGKREGGGSSFFPLYLANIASKRYFEKLPLTFNYPHFPFLLTSHYQFFLIRFLFHLCSFQANKLLYQLAGQLLEQICFAP